ncbi:MAG: 4-hydroxy-3-methylbut-2-enyl diphosphate reductase [Ignavibacteriaceae bacterium]|jgi:4-hydroxy-3-methylbut-2-enyl diphosphate reductase (EC 1.17.1.2)|nr:MAG: 4-hydroxy-3-methylbut-2-enyl diphosphate reductase [Chlorobiota bacterium]KXK01842.1 MAG: 4-hydroxy-3-methylbut-2-enyl diphosphate reductase [Chlorobi bacterium OLB4]MBV6399354.1 4-hydroxy-3-methylbut-2-enyl diphosphate reductase 2 [Ignavibacteria bacterium]MCC6886799.1 4-hydroxy-3-methylbut-2-enyl diphosphate reductase [Ignavibacteriales bacterium]MCE7953736.1 4-hydroxy-3-methylbut-2-enyl diphosphate reductase [Chlorobi bacterium CHB7]MDL1887670.1 4-hydroxy-3-methylbut-2-enyl diphosph
MKTFDIPVFYRSPIISKIKHSRKLSDPRKKDFSPTILDFGPVQFLITRHFGFCYGVENAIEISYKAIEENPDKRIFLLSEIIHNPEVNNDLIQRGVRFIMETSGKQLVSWNELNPDDIIIVPAFGTTIEIEKKLSELGIDPLKYNTTCPFVEKVWNRAKTLGESDYTVVVHGKYKHEETRATFSHSKENAQTIIIRDIGEAKILGDFILEKITLAEFINKFGDRVSEGFEPKRDLQKLGVINQTTMLATETQAIADYLKSVMIEKYGNENVRDHFADTRDTLCYATHENQKATYGLLEEDADLAIVVGGYNSSNTSHIVELCEEKLPTYFISSANKILAKNLISHFDYSKHKTLLTDNFLPQKNPVRIVLTSGASCPDALVDEVLQKILTFYPDAKSVEEVLREFE